MKEELFNIEKLLLKNSFFDKEKEKYNFIKMYYQKSFGEDNIKIYYFYYQGYNISFVCNIDSEECKAEQLEIDNPSLIENPILKSILLFENLKFLYNPIIESIYQDDDDLVVFLNSGVNIYYHKNDSRYMLDKIVSYDKPTRELVIDIMDRID